MLPEVFATFDAPLPLASLSMLADLLAGLAALFFLGAVMVFHLRSQGEHAFPRSTLVLIAFCLAVSVTYFARTMEVSQAQLAATICVFLAGVTLAVSMAYEMSEAIGFPSLRQALGQLEQQNAELESIHGLERDRTKRLALNSAVGVCIGEAHSIDELVERTAELVAEHLDLGLVRIWTVGNERDTYRQTAVAGPHAVRTAEPATISETRFNQLIYSVDVAYLEFDVAEDSQVLDGSKILAEGLEFSVRVPLRAESGVVGLMELFGRREFVDDDLQIFFPMANALAQAIKRDRVRRQLEASLDRFAALSDLSPAAIFVARRDARLTYANQAWAAMTGLSSVGSGGQPASEASDVQRWTDAIAEADAEIVTDALSEAVATEEPVQFVARTVQPPHSTRSGHQRDGEARVDRLVAASVCYQRDRDEYIGVLTDVTKLRMAEKRSSDQLQRLERVTELASQLANRRNEGLDDEAYLNELLESLLRVFDCRFAAIGTVETLSQEAAEREDLPAPSDSDISGGPTVRLFAPRHILDPVSDRAAGVSQTAGFDLTKRTRLSRSLRDVWETGRAGLSTADVRSPVGNRRLHGLIVARFDDSGGTPQTRASQSRDAADGEAEPSTLTRRTGGLIMVGDSRKQLGKSERDLLNRGAIIIGGLLAARHRAATERTRRKGFERSLHEKQAELEQLDRVDTLGELAAGLAHELNQPLAAITNFVAALSHRAKQFELGERDAVRMSESLTRISEQAARAAGIVRNIRAMINRDVPTRDFHSLPSLVEQALSLVRADARQRDIRLDLKTDMAIRGEGEAMVYANEIQIQQVVVNLVKNARDATDEQEKPRILVRIDAVDEPATGRRLRLRIDDNGPGLQGRTAEELFENYYSTKTQGLGIGLRICRSIVEACSGSINVDDSDLGGLCVTVLLPEGQASAITEESTDYAISTLESGHRDLQRPSSGEIPALRTDSAP